MVFYGSGSIFRIQNKLGNFRNYQILRKSDELQQNVYDKEASKLRDLLAGNQTRPKNQVPNIRDDLFCKILRRYF